MWPTRAGGDGTVDVIDVVVEFVLAAVAVVIAGVLLLGSRRGSTVRVRGRRVRYPRAWALALLLVGVVLLLRVALEVVPTGWQPAVVVAMSLAAAAGLVAAVMVVVRSRRLRA
jgi:hypothetical protein